ncbi:hypothetical protein DV515_00017680 [Chloebia gouldiae]|uniref:Lysosomal alpha-mannosidase n=1 Tax=Chloebia gouldiae TaxID=44316 RepID=A0A3L8Q9L3_CHLGU|nr:hypothetical protein DV515_00017680 [Chloebia gouldiae]
MGDPGRDWGGTERDMGDPGGDWGALKGIWVTLVGGITGTLGWGLGSLGGVAAKPGVSPEGILGLCRLELVGGGWCMSDEAAAHYGGALEQLALGRRFLRRLFGACGTPRVAWQIDPFGHARELAATFAQVGHPQSFPGIPKPPWSFPCIPKLPLGSPDLPLHPKTFPGTPNLLNTPKLPFGIPNNPPMTPVSPRWATMGSLWAWVRLQHRELELLWRGSTSLAPPHADIFTGDPPGTPKLPTVPLTVTPELPLSPSLLSPPIPSQGFVPCPLPGLTPASPNLSPTPPVPIHATPSVPVLSSGVFPTPPVTPSVPNPSFLSPSCSLPVSPPLPIPAVSPVPPQALVAGEVTVLSPGILPNMYNPPAGLCWDQLCTDPPVVDGDSPERNVDTVVTSFLEAAATQVLPGGQGGRVPVHWDGFSGCPCPPGMGSLAVPVPRAGARQYRTNHILMTMGSDFHYENAHLWFKNLDKLIAHANARVRGCPQTPSSCPQAPLTPFLSPASQRQPCPRPVLHPLLLPAGAAPGQPHLVRRAEGQAGQTDGQTDSWDDFFPYSDGPHQFWTGFFSSRPAFKGYERLSSGFLQVGGTWGPLQALGTPLSGSRDSPQTSILPPQICSQLEALAGPSARDGPYGPGDSSATWRDPVYPQAPLTPPLALPQHHDAVAGTERQHVADDYARQLAKGWDSCQVGFGGQGQGLGVTQQPSPNFGHPWQVLVANALSLLGGTKEPLMFCNALNISVCPLSETTPHVSTWLGAFGGCSGGPQELTPPLHCVTPPQFTVILYNPLARDVTWPVRLPVRATSYAVTDPQGRPVASQVSLGFPRPPGRTNPRPMTPGTPSLCPLNPPQVVPVSSVTQWLRAGAGGAPGELLFQAWAPPLGFSTFEVKQLNPGAPWDPPRWPSGDPEPQLENEVRGHRGGTWIWELPGQGDWGVTGWPGEVEEGGGTCGSGLTPSRTWPRASRCPSSRAFTGEFGDTPGGFWRGGSPAGGIILSSPGPPRYNASAGDGLSPQASGAYIFRPDASTPIPVAKHAATRLLKVGGGPWGVPLWIWGGVFRCHRTALVQELHQNFSAWCSQVLRLRPGQPYLELEWTSGQGSQDFQTYPGDPLVTLLSPLPRDGLGKEVISRFETPLRTAGRFYTDSNGRQVLERRGSMGPLRDFRPTWNLSQSEPVAGNYYPVNTRIFIKVLGLGRAQLGTAGHPWGWAGLTWALPHPPHTRPTWAGREGAADGADGSLPGRQQHPGRPGTPGGGDPEGGDTCDVHRRLLNDDNRGLGEPLDEPGVDGRGLVVRGRHLVLLDTVVAAADQHRPRAQEMVTSPSVVLAPGPGPHLHQVSREGLWGHICQVILGAAAGAAPQPASADGGAARRRHLFERGESRNGSRPLSVDLTVSTGFLPGNGALGGTDRERGLRLCQVTVLGVLRLLQGVWDGSQGAPPLFSLLQPLGWAWRGSGGGLCLLPTAWAGIWGGSGAGSVSDSPLHHPQTLFSAFTITSVQEMALGGDIPLHSVSRLLWNTATGTGGFGGVGLSPQPLPTALLTPPRHPQTPAAGPAGPAAREAGANGDPHLPGLRALRGARGGPGGALSRPLPKKSPLKPQRILVRRPLMGGSRGGLMGVAAFLTLGTGGGGICPQNAPPLLIPGHPPKFPDPPPHIPRHSLFIPKPTFIPNPPSFYFLKAFLFLFPGPPLYSHTPPAYFRASLFTLRTPPPYILGPPPHLLEAFTRELFQPGPIWPLRPLVLEPFPLLLQGGGDAPPGKARNELGTIPPKKGRGMEIKVHPFPFLGGFMPHLERKKGGMPHPGLALALGPQKASGFSGNRFKPRFRELGLASSWRAKEAWSLGWGGKGEGRGGDQGFWGGLGSPPNPTSRWGSYVGSTARIRAAGLESGSRSRFTGWSLAWEKHEEVSPSSLLTQQRMMSQSTAGGASVLTAETRNPACSRADLGEQRRLGGQDQVCGVFEGVWGGQDGVLGVTDGVWRVLGIWDPQGGGLGGAGGNLNVPEGVWGVPGAI